MLEELYIYYLLVRDISYNSIFVMAVDVYFKLRFHSCCQVGAQSLSLP